MIEAQKKQGNMKTLIHRPTQLPVAEEKKEVMEVQKEKVVPPKRADSGLEPAVELVEFDK